MLSVCYSVFSVYLVLHQLESGSVKKGSTPRPLVGCWDDLLTPSALATLCVGGERRSHSFTSVFDRRNKPRSVIENVLVSLLEKLDKIIPSSEAPFVEYWWRDNKPRMLEAHRDIDEQLCRKNQIPLSLGSNKKVGLQRCPTFGHVFYVDSTVLAPTLVFEEEGFGGGPPRKMQRMWSVPSCSNRLLRFRGDCIHAISYPPLVFLDMPYIENEQPISEKEDERRAVLLFNIWSEPPLYPPVGEPLSEAESLLWDEQASSSRQAVCNKNSSWRPAPTILYKPGGQETTTLSVPLLGGIDRRGCEGSSLLYSVEEKAAIMALTSSSSVHGINLHDLFSPIPGRST